MFGIDVENQTQHMMSRSSQRHNVQRGMDKLLKHNCLQWRGVPTSLSNEVFVSLEVS
jgi:hypothetical protein